jgi:hypothetical protein
MAVANTVFIPNKIITNNTAFASQIKRLPNCRIGLCGIETGPAKKRIGIRV